MLKLLSIAFLSFLTIGSQKEKGFDKFKNWYNNHKVDFVKTQSNSLVKYKARFEPATLICWKRSMLENTSYQSFRKSVPDFEQMNFSISLAYQSEGDLLKSSCQSDAEYNDKLNYINNEIKNDFILITNSQDSLKPNDSHFERTYGVSKKLNISLSFDKSKIDKLIYIDRIFTADTIIFDFNNSIVNNIKY